MDRQKKKFAQSLKKQGLRLTRERLTLYEGLKKHRGHFSVDTLLLQLKNKGYKVSRDTVYRNIPLLIDSGIVRQSFRTVRDTIYEVDNGKPHHDHLLCRKCGAIIEFANEEVERIQTKVAKRKGFKLEHHSHQLVGVCAKCQR